MSGQFVVHRSLSLVFFIAVVSIGRPQAAWGQAVPPPDPQHQHHQATPNDGPQSRDGSGTSWLPDDSPMYAQHWQRGAWQFMAHGNLFIQFLHESSNRGDEQFGSINWLMGSAWRRVGPGRLQLRGMFSAEPGTIPGCGYPDLLATGEQCDGEQIHDRQHPHDLFMELAARYDAPLKGQLRWEVYGGFAGEPALGPVAYPHRISSLANPLAPISHHWLDSSHITFGVITAGVYGTRWKAEASAFNGREPDAERTNIDLASLDSGSVRLWFLPTAKWSIQASMGKLTEAEVSPDGHGRIDVTRATASATYHRRIRERGLWSTTLAWGRNAEPHHASNAILLESAMLFADRDAVVARLEFADKSAHDLAVDEPPESFSVAKLQGGYTRYLKPWRGLHVGVGGVVSAGFVPPSLKATYGSRVNGGAGVFITLRPAAMTMMTRE
jgi:hypothetical protein